jgi:signal peptidase II
MSTGQKNLRWLWFALFVLLADQFSKWIAIHYLSIGTPVQITSFFNLNLLHNRGAAFSFLSSASGWQQWMLSIIAAVVSLVLLVWLYRLPPRSPWSALALTLVMGGAVGNLVDRLYYGYVIDFFDFHIQLYHWPVFNVADSAIVLGVFILLLTAFFGTTKRRKKKVRH